MGSSQSDEAKPRSKMNRGVSLTPYAKKGPRKSEQHQTKTSHNQLMEWKDIFIQLLDSEDPPKAPQWKTIEPLLLKCFQRGQGIKIIDINEDIQSFGFKNSTLQLQGSQYPLKSPTEQTMASQYSGGNYSTLNTNSLYVSKTNPGESSLMSPSYLKNSTLLSSAEIKPSTTQNARKIVLNEIKNHNYIVYELIKIFYSSCMIQFGGSTEKLDPLKFTQQSEEILAQLSFVIKRFINVLTNFIFNIYQEPLSHLESSLEEEDYGLSYLIEDILFELLFREHGFSLYNMVFRLLSSKYKEEITRFREVLMKSKTQSLVSYLEDLHNTKEFLLETSSEPYDESIKKITSLSMEANPYAKLEAIISSEEEFWGSVAKYHNNDNEILMNLRESFSTEFRLAIMSYCVVQAQNEGLIIERKLIEEFISPQILNLSYGFTVFITSIDFLLSEKTRTFSDLSPRITDKYKLGSFGKMI